MEKEKLKLQLLLKAMRWFHKKYLDGEYGGEAGSAFGTLEGIVEMHIQDKWRRK